MSRSLYGFVPSISTGCRFCQKFRGSVSGRSDSFFGYQRQNFSPSRSSSYQVNVSPLSIQTRSQSGLPQTQIKKDPEDRKPIKGALSSVGSLIPTIQWYPGHIAKAERTLKDAIKLVDVVIEVRDCRIPIATSHPEVPGWIGNRSRILAMNRADLAPEKARSVWRQHLQDIGEHVRFINAKQGRGVRDLKKLAFQAGAQVNEKRKRRGLLPRPIRCLVIGYPNVGKSALINRLVGRSIAKSANKPGVTRNFQWIRISDSIELLDMPGIIPAKFISQDTALRLAICDDIGQAAYDRQITAALMIEELKRVHSQYPAFFNFDLITERFKLDPTTMSGEEFLYQASKQIYKGDTERTAVRLLTEFRSGMFGPVALESPDMLGDSSTDIITRR